MNENNTETPVEMTAGEMLRNARTTGRRKREIPTISKQLCIREEFLQALEDGNYAAIPETVYILGFARNYAMELGLDPDEIVNKLKHEMGLNPECQDSNADNDIIPESGCAMPEGGKFNTFNHVYGYIVRNWNWFVGGLVALVALIIALVVFIPGGEKNPATVDADVPAVAVSTEPQYSVSVRERFGTENNADSNVILQATQESWVKIEDGRGNTVFSRVLVPGDIYYVPAGDKYKGTFGNAGGIDVWVNGKLAPKLGANHVRKSGISMNPESLMPATTVAAE